MIRPTKYTDLKTSVISVSAIIIAEMKQLSAINLDELREVVIDRLGDDAKINFLPSLSLLYALGKLNYDSDVDAIVSLVEVK